MAFCARQRCILRSNHHLRIQDIRVCKTNKYCLIKFTTYKHSNGPQVISIDEQTHGPIRPVKTIRTYLNVSNDSSSHQPLFDMTVAEFRYNIVELCQAAGIKSKVTPHCFRVDGATWASRQGWPDARIHNMADESREPTSHTSSPTDTLSTLGW